MVIFDLKNNEYIFTLAVNIRVSGAGTHLNQVTTPD